MIAEPSTPPHDVEVERALLGCLLRDGSRLGAVLEGVPESARNGHGENIFFTLAHQVIFSAIQGLHLDGLTIDPVTLQSRLRDAGQLDQVGGALYLSQLLDTPPAAPPEQYAKILLEKRNGRRQLAILEEIRRRTLSGDGGLDRLYKQFAEFQAEASVTGSNQALTLGDFLATPRPALRYWIQGFLPERGKMTISAVAKGFKTTLLIELGLCAAAGQVRYLNFDFGDPARVLLVQPELSDGLMAERFAWIMRTAPDYLDRGRLIQNFHVLETTCGRPSLWHAHPRGRESRRELEAALERTQANILLVDSLYMSFAGMDENAADQMTMALDYLGDLANRFGVAIILSHHFNKSGTVARGSSVYQGWGETDLSISTLDKDPSVVKVDALLRCSFAKGFPAYWQKPDGQTAWFEPMPEDWAPEKPGRKSKASPQLAVMVLRDSGKPLKYKDFVQSLQDAVGCGRSAATEAISGAIELGKIIKGGGIYALAQTETVR